MYNLTNVIKRIYAENEGILGFKGKLMQLLRLINIFACALWWRANRLMASPKNHIVMLRGGDVFFWDLISDFN